MYTTKNPRYNGMTNVFELYEGDRYVGTVSESDAAAIIRNRLVADASNVRRDILRDAVPKAQRHLLANDARAALQVLKRACDQLEKL